jgi:uncharacterized cupredoxin-like copper-binding protein
MSFPKAFTLAVIGGTAALAAALAPRSSEASAAGEEPRAPKVVTITARDFAFDAPDTLTAGLTTIRLVNQGPDLHHVQLIRLEGGHRLADMQKAMQAGGPPPAWARDVGGPNTPAPGAESNATLRLDAGRYALICFIPSADHVPHVMKGMGKEIVVVPPVTSAKAGAAMPKPDLTVTLKDYGFDFSGVVTPGRHTLRVRNAAAQSHEFFIARLEKGKTAPELIAWVDKPEGPPPALPLGGTTAMATGLENDITVDFEPGEYALICFVPDAKDGKPHFVHGMVHQLTVK